MAQPVTHQDTQPPAETLAIIEMLRSAEVQEGTTVFDHSAEEIGIAVMENHRAVLAALTRRAGGDAGAVRTCLTPGSRWRFHANTQRHGAADPVGGLWVTLKVEPPSDSLRKPFNYPEWYDHDWTNRHLTPAVCDELRDAVHDAVEPILARLQGNPASIKTDCERER